MYQYLPKYDVRTNKIIWKMCPYRVFIASGRVVKVDSEDYKKVREYKWFSYRWRNTSYVKAEIKADKGKRKIIYLHKLLNNTPKNLLTDHVNQSGLDNRKSNLRTVDRSGNWKNRRKLRRGTKSISRTVLSYEPF